MSIKLYDDALLKKLLSWTLDTNITVTGVNESTRLFSSVADRQHDKPIQLPLIVLSRPGGFVINDKYKQPKSYNGLTLGYNTDKHARLNAVQVAIPYQIDVYARYQEEADEYIRNIVFNIINYPKVVIDIPYNDFGISHESNIRLNSDIEDNSDVPERLISDQFKRYTVGLVIDDAYLFDVRVKDNVRLIEVVANTMINKEFDIPESKELAYKNYD